jgi:hypothetical protein
VISGGDFVALPRRVGSGRASFAILAMVGGFSISCCVLVDGNEVGRGGLM